MFNVMLIPEESVPELKRIILLNRHSDMLMAWLDTCI